MPILKLFPFFIQNMQGLGGFLTLSSCSIVFSHNLSYLTDICSCKQQTEF